MANKGPNMCKWMKNYAKALQYFEEHGNLDITQTYKTIDGVYLGQWISTCRVNFKKNRLTNEQIHLLNKLGMKWDYNNDTWNYMYEIAKAHYLEHGNLIISNNYVTKDGIKLGQWILTQRRAIHHTGTYVITNEQIELLNKIGMVWDHFENEWNHIFELVKNYYLKYGDLFVPCDFKTKDGVTYDNDGYNIYSWLTSQRYNKKINRLSDEQIKKLDSINFMWDGEKDKWQMMYKLCENNFEYYGFLNVNASLITKDGITYDENGYKLGNWINTQRKAFKNNNGKCINLEQIMLLDKLNIMWFSKNTDLKLQEEIIDEKNIDRKKGEIINRVYSCLDSFEGDELPIKEEINKRLIKELR